MIELESTYGNVRYKWTLGETHGHLSMAQVAELIRTWEALMRGPREPEVVIHGSAGSGQHECTENA
jgi:hypothetical protein